ncbi:MAG: DUF2089 family protein [Verrucomicrobiota bacterium]|jgi:hypothetical protein
METESKTRTRWIDLVEEEDLAFIKRFLLFSGSLKDLAGAYNVSYPTLRLRLDRLIEKIKILDNQKIEDNFERLLRAEFAEGKIETASFKGLLASYQKQREKSHEKTPKS